MAIFLGKINKRGHAPKVFSEPLPPGIVLLEDDFFVQESDGSLTKLKQGNSFTLEEWIESYTQKEGFLKKIVENIKELK